MDSPSPKKGVFILLCINKLGGAEFSMLKIARGLHDNGVPVTLVIYGRNRQFVTKAASELPILEIRENGSFFAMTSLIDLLKEYEPLVIVSALRYTNLVAILAARFAKTGTRVIITEHSPQEHGQGFRQRIVFPLMNWLYPLASAIVAVSQGIAVELNQRLKQKTNLHVIYNPVTVKPLKDTSVPHPWLEPGQLPVILGIGRLSKEKDFVHLIRAFSHVLGKYPSRLIILGEGSERETLAKHIAKLDLKEHVQMPGFVDDVSPWLTRAAIFVSSSRAEGFGNAIVEALLCRVPVVATDCPVGPREILDGGRYGLLVPVGDPAALARAIESVFANPPDTTAAYNHAQFFSQERCVANYLGLINELLPPRAP